MFTLPAMRRLSVAEKDELEDQDFKGLMKKFHMHEPPSGNKTATHITVPTTGYGVLRFKAVKNQVRCEAPVGVHRGSRALLDRLYYMLGVQIIAARCNLQRLLLFICPCLHSLLSLTPDTCPLHSLVSFPST